MHDARVGQTNCPRLLVNRPCILVTEYHLDHLLIDRSLRLFPFHLYSLLVDTCYANLCCLTNF